MVDDGQFRCQRPAGLCSNRLRSHPAYAVTQSLYLSVKSMALFSSNLTIPGDNRGLMAGIFIQTAASVRTMFTHSHGRAFGWPCQLFDRLHPSAVISCVSLIHKPLIDYDLASSYEETSMTQRADRPLHVWACVLAAGRLILNANTRNSDERISITVYIQGKYRKFITSGFQFRNSQLLG